MALALTPPLAFAGTASQGEATLELQRPTDLASDVDRGPAVAVTGQGLAEQFPVEFEQLAIGVVQPLDQILLELPSVLIVHQVGTVGWEQVGAELDW